jgi:hypothetical protein
MTSFHRHNSHDCGNSITRSIRSYLSQNDRQDTTESFIGESLATMIEYDLEAGHDLSMLDKKKRIIKRKIHPDSRRFAVFDLGFRIH